MPKKGIKSQKWTQENLIEATKAVKNDSVGYRRAAKQYGIPVGTLHRYIKSTENQTKKKMGRPPHLGKEIEDELAKYCKIMESAYFGLSRNDLRIMAYQLAIRNKKNHTFSETKLTAGKNWLKGFLKRHPDISFRQPTGTSISRVKGFNKESVNCFYNLLGEQYEKYNFQPHRIFNVDETGFSVVQSKHPKIAAAKGKRQIGILTSAERGSLITSVICMGATGIFVPPLFVFPKKKANLLLMRGAPPGSIANFHHSGWIQVDAFTQWFKHFINFVKPTESDPVLLILDGHTSHTKNIELIDLARANHVIILSLPPHSSHKMQPLDRSFMGPFKAKYSEEIRTFLRTKQRNVTQYEVAELFAAAYLRSQSAEIAVNGFKCSGIYPYNANVFKDEDFATEDDNGNDSPTCLTDKTKPTEQTQSNAVQSRVSPCDIHPIPQIKKKKNKRGRPPTKPSLLTSESNKNELLVNAEKSKAKRSNQKQSCVGAQRLAVGKKSPTPKKRKTVERQFDPKTKLPKNKTEKKAVYIDSFDEGDDSIIHYDDYSSTSETHVPNSEDTRCLICDQLWMDDLSDKTWIPCLLCQSWAHEVCSPQNENFICSCCKSKYLM